MQEAAETNPSVLNVRLKELREAHLVAHGDDGYGLTPHGKELLETFLPLHAWADKWARQFEYEAPRKASIPPFAQPYPAASAVVCLTLPIACSRRSRMAGYRGQAPV